ncbi:hypothetical protein S7711_01164 [Stachybotrys chartarum IBT 7711]|uniref:Uncharacterized protein n=1 Tax=Stachybotrys chartarum (strain CBS 109288 / IBT 7711) TaxID=1280523 RepID=A0A084ASV8_STACB|nr:hypothetical protein S7711_01164 [Stachybotrys chartarum IBT 7711]
MTASLRSLVPEESLWKDVTKVDIRNLPLRRSVIPFDELRNLHDFNVLANKFNRLLWSVRTFVEDSFGTVELHARTSPWKTKYPEDFYAFIMTVAREDEQAGGWDKLLTNGKERNMLLTAVVMKILGLEVLDSLLFGASKAHLEDLHQLDKKDIATEGFERSARRAQANLEYLNMDDRIPPLFWNEVDRLTIRTLIMLLPLYNRMGQLEVKVAPIKDMYFKLHDITATAGGLNYAMQLCPAVFIMEWARPGDRYDLQQRDLEPAILKFSTLKSQIYDHCYPADPPRRRSTRVKISISPKIVAYVPGPGDTMISHRLIHANGAFYNGLDDEVANNNTGRDLLGYVSSLHQKLTRPLGYFWIALLAMWGVFTWLFMLLCVLCQFDTRLADYWFPEYCTHDILGSHGYKNNTHSNSDVADPECNEWNGLRRKGVERLGSLRGWNRAWSGRVNMHV